MGVRWTMALAAAVQLAGCAAPRPQPAADEDMGPDGLYADFFDGKFDAHGHPLGAEILSIPGGCDSASGIDSGGWLRPQGEEMTPALACAAAVDVGSGPHAVNLRIQTDQACAGAGCDQEILRLEVFAGDELLAERRITGGFLSAAGQANVPLRFTSPAASELAIRVHHLGGRIELAYLEVFRTSQTVRIEPASGPDLEPGDRLRVDYLGSLPDDVELSLSCNGDSLDEALEELIDAGRARREVGEFRALVDAPAELLGACEKPRRVVATARRDWGPIAAARATYGIEPPPCSFEPDTTRVLVSGFEPFPADASGDNSSQQAVMAFRPDALPGVSTMAVVLPVEWHTGYRLLDDVIRRCQPDVVLSFGQGRDDIDVETMGYNLMDTSPVPGGVPDNRGVIESGTPIAADGPDHVQTGLPAQAIADALLELGEDTEVSTDPGRYICNNLFYELMRNHGDDVVAGFVHLPRDPHIDESERLQLGRVVETVLRTTLEELP